MNKFINHDIAHCNNASCKRKDTCRRYLAHLQAVRDNWDYCTYLMVVDSENCDNYWKDNINKNNG